MDNPTDVQEVCKKIFIWDQSEGPNIGNYSNKLIHLCKVTYRCLNDIEIHLWKRKEVNEIVPFKQTL